MAMKTMMNERCPIYNDFSCLSRRVTTEFKTSLKKNTFQHECYYIAIKLCKSSVICTQFNILAKKSTSPLLFQFFSLGNATFYYSTVWNFPICFLVYIGFSFSSSVFSFLIYLLQPTELWKRTKRMVNPTHKKYEKYLFQSIYPQNTIVGVFENALVQELTCQNNLHTTTASL